MKKGGASIKITWRIRNPKYQAQKSREIWPVFRELRVRDTIALCMLRFGPGPLVQSCKASLCGPSSRCTLPADLHSA